MTILRTLNSYTAGAELSKRAAPPGTGGLSGTSVWRPQSRYTVSRMECRIKFPQNQRCRAKIALHLPKSRCRTFLRNPLSHFPLIRSKQGARRAGGGYRGTFGFRKRIALQGGIAATVTPVALLCATKLKVYKNQSPIMSQFRIPPRLSSNGTVETVWIEQLLPEDLFL